MMSNRLRLSATSLLSNTRGSQTIKCFSSLSTPAPETSPLPSANVESFNFKRANQLDSLFRCFQNFQFRVGGDPRLPITKRKKVVVLGTGWAAMNFIKGVDVSKYDISIVSPRNYFTFSPLLPSVCAGTLSTRSCMEPVRNKLMRGGKRVMEFYEGWGVGVEENKIQCRGKSGAAFDLPYDYLVMTVGAETNTFGIPGVADHAFFLKEVENARNIQKKVIDSFEEASLPSLSEEQKRKLLTFVVVGGGPTGVETAAELADFIHEDVVKHFPHLVPLVKISLVEMLPKVLPMFSQKVSDFSIGNLRRLGVDMKMQTRVTKLTKDDITVVDANNQEQVLPCGFVLWASGVGQVPFAKTILDSVAGQKGNRIIRVDEKLRVIGAEASIYAMGDCTYFTPELLTKHAEWLFKETVRSTTGAGTTWLESELSRLSSRFPQLDSFIAAKPAPRDHLSFEDFSSLLKEIDSTFKPPPPTAQNATLEGRYLSAIFNRHTTNSSKDKAPAYIYRWQGSMAYVGHGQSVIDLPTKTLLGGYSTNLLWKIFYWQQQMSTANKLSCVFDWIKSVTRGRDMGRDHTAEAIPKIPSESGKQKAVKPSH